jgi:DNA-binding response OmpR family regulator
VILDVMMPGMDGFEVLRELRKTSDVPVLMLTAMGEETDRIVGLETGADDYLPKTFSTRELLARLRAVTRRTQRTPSRRPGRRRHGGRRAAAERRHPHGGDRRPTGGADRPGIRDPRRVAALQGPGEVPRGLDRKRLRPALRRLRPLDRRPHLGTPQESSATTPSSPRFIRTIRGVGYMLVEPDRES